MKNICILVIIIFIGFYSCISLAQTTESNESIAMRNDGWQLFRSDDAYFRFLYPPSWHSKTPQGKNVKALVVGEDGNNCNVVVNKLPTGYRVNDFWAEVSIEDMIPSSASLIDSKKIHLNNRKAWAGIYDLTYKTMDRTIDFRATMVMAIENNALYTVGCGSQIQNFDANYKMFNNIIRSFVFETWENDSNSGQQSLDGKGVYDLILETADEGEYGLLAAFLTFSFIVTWGIGLTPPLLIRYVFYRRPLNKWPAIGYCTLFLFANISIFTILGSESKTHNVLVIIAFVSYYIFKRAPQKDPVAPTPVDKPKTKEGGSKTPIKPGKEVVATITALKKLRPEYDSTSIFHSSVVDDAFKQAKKLIRADKKGIIKGIAKNGRDPTEIVLTALWSVSNQAVSSGQHHIYRGILSDQGKGYFYVYNKTIDILLDKGCIDEKEAENSRKAIQESIKSVG